MRRMSPADARIRRYSPDVLRTVPAAGAHLFHAVLAKEFGKFILLVCMSGLSAYRVLSFLSLGESGVSLQFVISD